MKTILFFTLFALAFQLNVDAQYEERNWQSADLAKLGVLRMDTKKTTRSENLKDSVRILTTETYFDSLGRIIRSVNDACSQCGVFQEFDSISGLVSYIQTITPNKLRESFYEYDVKNRRKAIETCEDGNEDNCSFYSYEYDEENTERMYWNMQKKSIKLDTTKRSKRFLRIYSQHEKTKQLAYERFFSPEGKLEETRKYHDGKFLESLLYEYDKTGRMARTWHFDGKIKQLYQEVERNEIGQLTIWKTYALSSGDPLHTLSEPSIQTYEYDDNGLLVRTYSKRVTMEYTYYTE